MSGSTRRYRPRCGWWRRTRGVIAVWGAIVVALLVLGSLPALVGLTVVLPVLGHATWHLYRRAVAW